MNIHAIPTDKPSRLCYNEDKNKFTLKHALPEGTNAWRTQHIYITSDEEITDGDWALLNYPKGIEIKKMISNISFQNSKCINSEIKNDNCNHKKIIITTDPELIKDGVQAIDDEFLQWFVKNSSCERIKVLRCPIEGLYTIIPKEEVLIQSSIDGEVIWSTAKETLEEVAERILFENTNNIEIHYRGGKENVIKAMIEIAKYQAKEMYSEEEVMKSLRPELAIIIKFNLVIKNLS